MLEQGDLLLISLIHYSQTAEKSRVAAQKMSKSGFFWDGRKQILADFRAEIQKKKKRIPGRVGQRSIHNFERSNRVSTRRNLSCSSRRRTTSSRSTTSSKATIRTKSGSSWSSWEKSQWDGRLEAISRLDIRQNCEEKIDRRSTYNPWIHRQFSGIAEWCELHEWFKRFSRCWISSQWKFPRYQSTSVVPTSSSSWWNAEPQRRAAKHLGTHMVFRETFLSIQMRRHQHLTLKNWISGFHRERSRFIHPQCRKVKGKKKDQDQRCQSRPSTRNSVIFSGRDYSKNYGADQHRLQILDLHFDKFFTPATFACWKIRFKIWVCICSQYLTEAILWMKEVEMVESVYEL